MAAIHPVVLSGGSGTRLWPLSRAMYPKQFIRFSDDQPETFLAAALKRLGAGLGFAPPIVVCSNDHRFLVKDEAERARVRPSAIVLEPVARNTAAAVAVAALLIERDDPAGILVVMPSDHVTGTSGASSPPCAKRRRWRPRASSFCSGSPRAARIQAMDTSSAAAR
jgi:mannose-1-phosphate guanylyltransferase/mannose-6-phosphate isomerase